MKLHAKKKGHSEILALANAFPSFCMKYLIKENVIKYSVGIYGRLTRVNITQHQPFNENKFLEAGAGLVSQHADPKSPQTHQSSQEAGAGLAS